MRATPTRPLSRREVLALTAVAAGSATLASTAWPGPAPAGAMPLPEPARLGAPPPQPGARGPGYFPPVRGDGWEAVSAREAGWDAAALAAALRYAGEHASRGVVVLHRGRILAERYWRQADARTTRDVASAQKSVVAVLVGVAVRRGALSLTDPVSRWLGPGWSRAPRAAERRITVRHLLTMTSGLDDDLRLLAPAGSQWRYTNAAYHRLHPTLEAATGRTLSRFSQEVLFGPIGMSSARWETRGAGRHEGEAGLVMTPRDMARFGLLVLAGTRWAGRPPMVQPAYLRAALSPSQRHNPSYGYLWWLNGQPSYRVGADPRSRPGPIIPAAPADLVAALGAADQKIHVVPSLDLVVVRQGARGGPPGLGRTGFDNAWWARLRQAAPAVRRGPTR